VGWKVPRISFGAMSYEVKFFFFRNSDGVVCRIFEAVESSAVSSLDSIGIGCILPFLSTIYPLCSLAQVREILSSVVLMVRSKWRIA